jgi:hypothetical protein
MALGLIDQTVLADIANAIRFQNGGQAAYRPADMASAVAALDGTASGTGAEIAAASRVGVVPEAVFAGVADAIRRQNGLDATYKPGEMADAIRALAWDTGLKPRALFLSDGTLEFNYLDGRQVRSGAASVVKAWEVSVAGYAKDADKPWHAVRGEVRRAWVDESFALAGATDISYWFANMPLLTEVFGFQHLQGATKAVQCFASSTELRSVWAPGFDASSIASCTSAFYSCRKLVGGHLAVSKDTSGKTGFSTGATGFFADPADDERVWVRSWLHADGSLLVTRTGAADAGKTVAASGTLCANARYNALGSMPWHELRATIRSVRFAADMAEVAAVCMDYWFYGCAAEAIAFAGWSNLAVTSMEFCFSGCTNLMTLDLRGLSPAQCKRWAYAFAGMGALTAILVSAGWALPSPLTSITGTFYGDKLLMGGNGTAYNESKTTASMAVVDAADKAGYLTAG